MVRDRIGPVAAFKTAVVVKRLPKTRSGKILRGTMQKIADSEAWKAPATIDDPAILGEIGIFPLVVTTSLNINFLRKPSASAPIIGVCKLMKLGRTLAVGEVSLYSEGEAEPVAHVVGTYSIPPGTRS